MAIKFVCPNGHQLSAAHDRAGKPGKCPKCQTKFLVPDAEEFDGDSSVETPKPASNKNGASDTPKEETIVFLCPNGHELNGPASLKGRPGQCPHCGEKFRIPTFEDGEEEPTEHANNQHVAEVVHEFPEVPVDVDEIDEFDEYEAVEVVDVASSFSLGDENSLADVFLQFWQERGRNEVVQLHLRDGKIIAPDFFAAGVSQGDCGIFAVKEKDGSHTLTAVAWDAVTHIVLGNVKQLPSEIFD